jgi:hypothetical protein
MDAVMSSGEVLPYTPYLHPAATATIAALPLSASATAERTLSSANAAGTGGILRRPAAHEDKPDYGSRPSSFLAEEERTSKRARLDLHNGNPPPPSCGTGPRAGSMPGSNAEYGSAAKMATAQHISSIQTPPLEAQLLAPQHAAGQEDTHNLHLYQGQVQQQPQLSPFRLPPSDAAATVLQSSASPSSASGLKRPLRPQGLTRMPSSEHQAPARWFVPALRSPSGVHTAAPPPADQAATMAVAAAAPGVDGSDHAGNPKRITPESARESAAVTAAPAAAAPVLQGASEAAVAVAASNPTSAPAPAAAVSSGGTGFTKGPANNAGADAAQAVGGNPVPDDKTPTTSSRSSGGAFTVVTYNVLAQKFVG